jgi:GT2 family glycosyltransferase
VDIVYSDVLNFRARNQFEEIKWMPKVSGKGHQIAKVLLNSNIMVVNAPLIRRKAIDDIGYFDEELRAVEDWHYWIRGALLGKYFYYFESANASALVRNGHLSMMQITIRWVMQYIR